SLHDALPIFGQDGAVDDLRQPLALRNARAGKGVGHRSTEGDGADVHGWSSLSLLLTGSRSGTAATRCWVYGCVGASSTDALWPSSTIAPARITQTRSAMLRTTA